MRSSLFVLMIGVMLCFVNLHVTQKTQAFTCPSQSDFRWIELEEISMSAYFDGSWHYVNATLFKFDNANLVYRVLYDYKFYNVITYIENNEIKCSVWIPYQGSKKCFSFVLQFD